MTIKIGVWNIRGLNQKKKQKEIRNLIGSNNLNMCVILESRVQVNKLEGICYKVFGNWIWSSNSSECTSGTRIIIGWNPAILSPMILNFTDQVMHSQVNVEEGKKVFFYSFIYAANHYKDRRDLWNSLIKHNSLVKNMPWTLMGDFNVALDPSYSTAGNSGITKGVDEFQDCIHEIEVQDLNSNGLHYTWNQKPKGSTGILKKLDRIMGNLNFIDSFPRAFLTFLPYGISDHSPCILQLPWNLKYKAKPFKFSNVLTLNDQFLNTVKQFWSQKINGFEMFVLAQKLKTQKTSSSTVKRTRKLYREN